MDKENLIRELRQLIGDFLQAQGVDLVDLIYRFEGRGPVLRILADWPEGGITLGECSRLNQEIARLLDEKEIIAQSYLLEVSSPGIDRPLKNREDFTHSLQRQVRFFLNQPVNGKVEWAGLIKRVEDNAVFIEQEDVLLEIPLASINKARQEIGKN